MKKDLKDKMLTEVELEMMMILWKIEPCTVSSICEHLPKERELAYTSVSTIIRILEQKGFLKSKKDGRAHIYSSYISKEDYEKSSLIHLMKNVFEDHPVSVIKCLLNSNRISNQDLVEMKKLLEENLL